MSRRRGRTPCDSFHATRRLPQDAIKLDVGYDLLQRKLPSFAFNENFTPPSGLPAHFNVDAAASAANATYDFLLAQSIFTHTAEDMFLDVSGNCVQWPQWRPHPPPTVTTSPNARARPTRRACTPSQAIQALRPHMSSSSTLLASFFLDDECPPDPDPDPTPKPSPSSNY